MERIMQYLFPSIFPTKIISTDKILKCCLCGFWTKDPIKLQITRMGKVSEELYCQHCYEMEKYSIPTPCSDGCKKCAEIR